MVALKKIQLKKLQPLSVLRIGLGLTFVYAASDMLLDPQSWVNYVPKWMEAVMSIQTFLYVHSIFELVLGLALIAGLWPRLVSFIAFLDLLAVLVFYGISDETFRDFGLMMSSLALFILTGKEK